VLAWVRRPIVAPIAAGWDLSHHQPPRKSASDKIRTHKTDSLVDRRASRNHVCSRQASADRPLLLQTSCLNSIRTVWWLVSMCSFSPFPWLLCGPALWELSYNSPFLSCPLVALCLRTRSTETFLASLGGTSLCPCVDCVSFEAKSTGIYFFWSQLLIQEISSKFHPMRLWQFQTPRSTEITIVRFDRFPVQWLCNPQS
jgi:hypothetical protein